MGAAEELTEAFAALADPVRRDIVERLADGEATVGEIARAYPISKQAVSRHIKVLEAAGLVGRGETRTSPVHLEAKVLSMTAKWLERHRLRVEARYSRLDHLLADMPDDPPEPSQT